VTDELPPASSLRAPRRETSSRKGRRGRLLILAFGAAAATAAAIAVSAALSRPRLESIEPRVGEAGQTLRLRGRNFGDSRNESRVELDGAAPTSGSYLLWTDGEIALRLPSSLDSCLVRVATRHGVSDPELFMTRSDLPVFAPRAESPAAGPRIASISEEEGTIGSLLVVKGSGFGESRGESRLLFSRSSGAEYPSSPGEDAPPPTVAPSEAESGYELWSDSEIRSRVPDGAATGPVCVDLGKARSNSAFFRVYEAAGAKRRSSRTRYSISQSVDIAKVRASGPAELYLWVPRPADSASQRLVSVLDSEPEPMVSEYRGTSLFRLSDLASGKGRSVRQSFLVDCWAVEASIDPGLGPQRPPSPPALMAAFSRPDELVPSEDPAVRELARKILRGERGSWRAARLVWDWLIENLRWTGRHQHERALDSLKDKSADSWSYAIVAAALLRAAGLPTLPVAGYLVDPSRKAVRHYWVEVYLYGLGWVPLDPVLGSGASPQGVRAPWEERARYFGGLDDRHIAFSRGLSVLAPLSPEGRRVSRERRWSFQSFYEESRGALKSYSSNWADAEVTGMY
jgi:transglutaminase-like putative cysteine protease